MKNSFNRMVSSFLLILTISSLIFGYVQNTRAKASEDKLVRQRLIAEKSILMAEENAENARIVRVEAERQAELAKEAMEELKKCSGK